MTSFAVKSIRHRAKYDRRLALAERSQARVGQKREGLLLAFTGLGTRGLSKPYRVLPMATRAQLEQVRCQPHERTDAQRVPFTCGERSLLDIVEKQLHPAVIAVSQVRQF